MVGVNDALVSGAMEALRHLEARSKGMQIVFDLVDGRREPQNDFERMLLFKAQEIVAPTHAMSTNFISIENDEICLSLAPVEEPSLEEAFNSVVVGINLADFAPALPASY
jgi:hypothetical protein